MKKILSLTGSKFSAFLILTMLLWTVFCAFKIFPAYFEASFLWGFFKAEHFPVGSNYDGSSVWKIIEVSIDFCVWLAVWFFVYAALGITTLISLQKRECEPLQ